MWTTGLRIKGLRRVLVPGVFTLVSLPRMIEAGSELLRRTLRQSLFSTM
jgi:hypothetical protein